MDYLRHDLRDALDEVNPEVVQTSGATTARKASVAGIACSKCKSLPAPGCKLRYCGRCKARPYCSRECAKADWSVHTRVCDSMRRAHDEALAGHEARGGRGRDLNQKKRETLSWFVAVPGLSNEVELLAWKHRDESPLILVSSTNPSDTEGSDVRVVMIPRGIWDEDPRFLDTYSETSREHLRDIFDDPSCCLNTQFVRTDSMQYSEGILPTRETTIRHFRDDLVRSAEIVEALTATTRAEDLVNAFAWLERVFRRDKVVETLKHIRHRATTMHGSITPDGSVPVSSRALNNEVAYMMFNCLCLEFSVRLTGLRSAVHLNGREGVVRGLDPKSIERWNISMDDGTYVSVRAVNFEYIRRGDYKRRSP